MKKIHLIYIITTLFCSGLTMQSCSSILDATSKDTLTDPTVWGNKEAVLAALGKVYDQMQTENFGYIVLDEGGFPSQITDEAVRSYTWGAINDPIISDGAFGWWGYGQVREANSFIQNIKESEMSEADKVVFEAEARFVRAFHYFAMAKRYGGVPLITTPQEFTGNNIKELMVPRNTEKEIYDFICEEVDEIVPLLPEDWDVANQFRATRYSALALKSRAMLYAGTIATYGKVDLNGLVGIPSENREHYLQESKKASLMIMDSKKFSLYRKKDNKEENYQSLFLDKTKHSELLFSVAYKAPDKGHNWDYYNAPQSFKVDYGCVTNPTLQMVEEFDYIDGSDGKLRVSDSNGNPVVYSNPYDLFKDKDPRMLASIMVPFSTWKDGYLEIRRGIIDQGKTTIASNLIDTYGSGANQITISGKDGLIDVNDPTKTGFYIKKFMSPTIIPSYNRSEANWVVFRYAETLLNYAEACAELNEDLDKALVAINDVRDRAGVANLDECTIENVRKERKVEFAFENQRWWDMRRWRVATQILDNYQAMALHPFLIWEEGKHPSEMKYIFKVDKAPKNTRTFLAKHYYEVIPWGQIGTNSNILQNPGY